MYCQRHAANKMKPIDLRYEALNVWRHCNSCVLKIEPYCRLKSVSCMCFIYPLKFVSCILKHPIT